MGRWMRQGLVFAAAIGLAGAAGAEVPAPSQSAAKAAAPVPAASQPSGTAAVAAPTAWDDSHMASRYEPTPPGNRPRLEGETGYALLARGGAEPRTRVDTELEFTSQRQWVQGALPSKDRDAGSVKSQSGGVHRGGRGAPSSALRAASVHSSR